jgi:hypothetical protein
LVRAILRSVPGARNDFPSIRKPLDLTRRMMRRSSLGWKGLAGHSDPSMLAKHSYDSQEIAGLNSNSAIPAKRKDVSSWWQLRKFGSVARYLRRLVRLAFWSNF